MFTHLPPGQQQAWTRWNTHKKRAPHTPWPFLHFSFYPRAALCARNGGTASKL